MVYHCVCRGDGCNPASSLGPASALLATAALLLLLGTCIRFRMREHEELLGADYVEHNVHRHGLGITRAVSVLGSKHEDIVRGHVPVGKNKVRLLLCIC